MPVGRLNLTRQCITNRHRAWARLCWVNGRGWATHGTPDIGNHSVARAGPALPPLQNQRHPYPGQPSDKQLGVPTDRTAEPTARSQLVPEQLYRQGTGLADQGSYVRLQRRPAVIRMMLEGKVDLRPFITCRIALENLVEQGFAT